MEDLPLEFGMDVTIPKEGLERDQLLVGVRDVLLHAAVGGMTRWLVEHGSNGATFEIVKLAEESEDCDLPGYNLMETRIRLTNIT
jgi:hypothetical protein